MDGMNVSLTPQLEEFVAGKVREGRYQTASEVVREALRLLQEREQIRAARLEQLRKEVEVGLKDIAEGRIVDMDVDKIKDGIRKRVAQRRKDKSA